MDIQDLPGPKVETENIPLSKIREAKVVQKKEYEVVKREVSQNIKRFDRIDRTKNPYDYNTISLSKKNVVIDPKASDMIADDLYNSVGKMLGVDTKKEWGLLYDKVFSITEWAKKQVKSNDKNKIIKHIMNTANKVPSFGNRRINDFYVYINL